MSAGRLYVSLGEVSVRVLCLFFNWVGWWSGVELYEFFSIVYFKTNSVKSRIRLK